VSTGASEAVAAGRTARAPRPRGLVVRQALGRAALPAALLAPALVVIGGLIAYPVVRTIWLSFTDTRLGDLINGTGDWVGFQQYQEVFTDESLRQALIVTVVFGTACVVGTMIVGFAVALLLNQRLWGTPLLALIVLLPWAVPALAASSIFAWLFDSRYGFINWALVEIGFDRFRDYAWAADATPALISIFVTVVWQSFPFIALSLLAGLQTVPRETLEAASVDGAHALQRFFLVTLPQLRPIVAVLVIFSTIWDFRIFDQVYVLAAGVPDRAADTAVVKAYRESFALGHFGTGAAIAVVTFVVLMAFALVYMRVIGKEQTK
jgi:N,N'-diacetylchitobiose transport system permease protein